MLDAGGAFEVPGLDDLVVYPDDRLAHGFYVLARAPRLARGPDGDAEIDLTAYGRREHGVLTVRGAVLSLTTVLAVPERDLATVRAALARRLADAWPPGTPGEPPAPVLLAPEWMSAEVVVDLGDGVTLTGAPSLAADQRFSSTTKLDADQARRLQQAWGRGLPGATITYRGRLRTAGAPALWTRTTAGARTTTTSVRGAGPGTLEVELAAPLAASVPDLAGRATTTELP